MHFDWITTQNEQNKAERQRPTTISCGYGSAPIQQGNNNPAIVIAFLLGLVEMKKRHIRREHIMLHATESKAMGMRKAITTHCGTSKQLNGQPQPCMTADKPEHHGKLLWSWHSRRRSSYTPATHVRAAGTCFSACKHGDLTDFDSRFLQVRNTTSTNHQTPLRHHDYGAQWLTQRAAICEAGWKLVSKGSG